MAIIKTITTGQLPYKASKGAAGFDLFSTETTYIPERGLLKIPIGLRMQIPAGYYGEIVGRSGLSSRGILCATGVIDSDYRGDVCVTLYNLSEEPYKVCKGDRIAQLIIHAIPDVEFEESFVLDDTERGLGGFGSTGK